MPTITDLPTILGNIVKHLFQDGDTPKKDIVFLLFNEDNVRLESAKDLCQCLSDRTGIEYTFSARCSIVAYEPPTSPVQDGEHKSGSVRLSEILKVAVAWPPSLGYLWVMDGINDFLARVLLCDDIDNNTIPLAVK